MDGILCGANAAEVVGESVGLSVRVDAYSVGTYVGSSDRHCIFRLLKLKQFRTASVNFVHYVVK